MDPGTGNIYDYHQAKALGLDLDDLISLTGEEASRLLALRRVEALALTEQKQKRRAKTKAGRKQRRRT
jgi:hypothetical protein